MRVVVLSGPESTGKSWLANDLHRRFGGLLVGEYVRQFIDNEKRDTCYADVAVIARRQLIQEDAARQQRPELLILDTNLLSNMLWSRTLFSDCPAWLEKELLARHYDQYLLLSPDGVPWTADGQRCQPEAGHRRAFYQDCKDWLSHHQQPVVEVGGSWTARQERCRKVVTELLSSERRG
ncbi:AAA family ATPase [Pseudomonas sp. gcc21]|uniref:AAA family ATPase n=1 Tax=Pseudomonas sp. gcc21 TaxID=2726989 RepID=UPI0014520557|nr:AAA family ATPase [Pseudomonas sp. gcc21]QJD60795.1 AAA family ATPase [Pseudomonas sp. gcc21]